MKLDSKEIMSKVSDDTVRHIKQIGQKGYVQSMTECLN